MIRNGQTFFVTGCTVIFQGDEIIFNGVLEGPPVKKYTACQEIASRQLIFLVVLCGNFPPPAELSWKPGHS
ncbi:MAG: hypothetical protein LRY51_11625, partial [Geovibrio sp.]|nr:hypothetical protein [Geovibrio sp.]